MSEEGFFCKAKERVLQNFEKIEKNSDQGYRDDEQFTLNKDKCIDKRTSLMGYRHNHLRARSNNDRKGAYSPNKIRIA